MDPIIILLDTGIDKKIFGDSLIDGKHFFVEEDFVCCDDCFDDDNGHGTACACIIKSVLPSAKFYAIKILDNYAETTYPVLEAALEYCLGLEYHVINLSLSIVQNHVNASLFKLCNTLKDNGKIIISSVHNGHVKSYPALYPSVIGVRGSRFTSPAHYWYNADEIIQCVADITPSFTNRSLDNFLLFGGNSKACALMSGILLKGMEEYVGEVSLDSANCFLQQNAQKKSWEEYEINTSTLLMTDLKTPVSNPRLDYMITIKEKLEYIAEYNQSSFSFSDNLFDVGLLHPTMIKDLILILEKTFCVTIPNSYICYDSLVSIMSISRMIEGVQNEKTG